MWFPNRSDTNQAAQSQKQARSFFNFGFKKKRKCTIHVAKKKALISFAVTVKLICVFVFEYADCWFSHKVAQLSECLVIYHLMKLSHDEKVMIIVMFYRFRT